jgi:hypothetical protein
MFAEELFSLLCTLSTPMLALGFDLSMPTVICVGRRSKMATGLRSGSRTVVMFDSSINI